MPGYKFDQALIPSVLADPLFQMTGAYGGDDSGLHYVVLDPRRRSAHVWTKASPFVGAYQLEPCLAPNVFFTNGPLMSPPPSRRPKWLRIFQGLLAHATGFGPVYGWQPLRTVIAGNQIVNNGAGTAGAGGYFARVGFGRYEHYLIGRSPMPGVAGGRAVGDGIDGLVLLVLGGGIVTSSAALELQTKDGVAVWAKVPLAAPLDTREWESEVPYLPGDAEIPQNVPPLLTGVIVAAGVGSTMWNPLPSGTIAWVASLLVSRRDWNTTIASDLLAIGASDAVATDPSDSVICGRGGTLLAHCAPLKDLIQQYGWLAR
jgi:hypothetical protein